MNEPQRGEDCRVYSRQEYHSHGIRVTRFVVIRDSLARAFGN